MFKLFMEKEKRKDYKKIIMADFFNSMAAKNNKVNI